MNTVITDGVIGFVPENWRCNKLYNKSWLLSELEFGAPSWAKTTSQESNTNKSVDSGQFYVWCYTQFIQTGTEGANEPLALREAGLLFISKISADKSKQDYVKWDGFVQISWILGLCINGLVTGGNTQLCCRGFILALFQSTTANKIDSEHTWDYKRLLPVCGAER